MEGWIALTRTSTLGQQPRKVTLSKRDYVVWRNNNNEVQITSDACRHRGASLSGGKVLRDGYLECPYHGWKYSENKLCKPWVKDCTDMLQIDFDKKDQSGLLWIRPKGLVGPDPPEVPHVTEPGFSTMWFETTIKQSAQMIIENGIDPCHASWVHANPLGFGTAGEKPTNVVHKGHTIEFDYVPNSEALSTKLFGLSTTHNFHAFVLPYTTWSDVVVHGDKVLMTYVTLCPIDEFTTKMFVGFSQNFGVPSSLFVLMGKAIVEQDRAILENLDSSFRFKGMNGEHDELVVAYREALHNSIFK